MTANPGSVTISFAPGASDAQDTGTYASAVGEQDGVLLLDNPEGFAGTINGFAPGDRIVLPTLTNLSVFNISSSGFEVEGEAAGNTMQSEIITIHAGLAGGLSPAIETDAAGDQVIGLRPAGAELTLDHTSASAAELNAVSGVAMPVDELGLLVPADASAGLVLTVSAVHGLIDDGGASAGTLVLTAANALAMNGDLAALFYRAPATGSGDVLDFTGSAGLAGLSAAIGVAISPPSTLDFTGGSGATFATNGAWAGDVGPAVGDLAVFGSHAGAPVIVAGPGVAGAVTVGGGFDFAGPFDFAGLSGTALDVGAGGFALFDANAIVTLGGAAIVGDVTGAGTLGVAGTIVAPSTVFIVGGVSQASGSLLEVTGDVSAVGLVLGTGASATLDVTGDAGFAVTTLGGAGTSGVIRASGNGEMALGSLDIVAGTLDVVGSAVADARSAMLQAGNIGVSGGATLSVLQELDIAGGVVDDGPLAVISAGAVTLDAGGSIAVAGSLAASSLESAGGFAITGGVAVFAGTVVLASGGDIELAGGNLAASGVSVSAGATMIGYGAIGGVETTVLLPSIVAPGIIEASGGTLILSVNLDGGATIEAGAALELGGAATNGTISFAGPRGRLTIDAVGSMQDQVVGFAAGDAIDLIGVAPAEVSIANGTVSIADPSAFGLATGTDVNPSVSTDGAGGSLITAGGAMPCFARGTALLTPAGNRPVESLRPGDELVTVGGEARPVRWIGWRTIDLATDRDAGLLRPVIIEPGAFGPGQPRRRLTISPLHAIFHNGVLVPAVLLVNGATVIRDDRAFAVTYYHVELDRHDVVLAEGLETETYRDNGNRGRFAFGTGAHGGPMPAYARLVTDGGALRAVRAVLHARAFALGYQLIHGVAMTVDTVSAVHMRGRWAHLDLQEARAEVSIRVVCGAPAETDPGSEDRRRVGICAGRIRADGRILAVKQGSGWHARAPEDRGWWSEEQATLRLPQPVRQLAIEIIGSVPRWQRAEAVVAI